MTKAWVRVTSPTAQFMQEVDGAVEHVIAVTRDGRQVPVATLVTLTNDVRKALRGDTMKNAQPDPFAPKRPPSIELCTPEGLVARIDVLRAGVAAALARHRAELAAKLGPRGLNVGPRFHDEFLTLLDPLEREVAQQFEQANDITEAAQ
jgi:hypothetical protein